MRKPKNETTQAEKAPEAGALLCIAIDDVGARLRERGVELSKYGSRPYQTTLDGFYVWVCDPEYLKARAPYSKV